MRGFAAEKMQLRGGNVGRVAAVLLMASVSLFIGQTGWASQRVLVVMKENSSFRQIDTAYRLSGLRPLSLKSLGLKSLGTTSLAAVNGDVTRSLRGLRALVMKIDSNADFARLQNSHEVLFVEREVIHPLPAPLRGLKYRPFKSSSSLLENPAREISRLVKGTPWGINAVKAKDAWSTARRGEGTRVLILDTGIDKDHPAIAANLEVGEDFVHDGNLPYPYADSIGHGTHVAGTIAAVEDVASGFTGVAPSAKILAGRVCNADGCSNISIAEGINWGIEKKVQVISMSLGGLWSTPAERNAITLAEESGVSVVAASGNSGIGRVGYPAALPTVIAVGAVDSTLKKADFSQWGPELDIVAPGVDVISSVPMGSGRESKVEIAIGGEGPSEVLSTSFAGAKELPAPLNNTLVFAGLGKREDLAQVDVRGKFALVQRGEIMFSEKAKNALAAGALGLLIFNNAPGLIRGALTDDGSTLDIAVAMIEQDPGEKLRDALLNGGVGSATLQTLVTNYASFDGTSMACPHVSGVVALIRAANPRLTPQQVRNLVQETAVTPTESNTNNEYGAGLIDADAAVKKAVGM